MVAENTDARGCSIGANEGEARNGLGRGLSQGGSAFLPPLSRRGIRMPAVPRPSLAAVDQVGDSDRWRRGGPGGARDLDEVVVGAESDCLQHRYHEVCPASSAATKE